MKLQGKDAIVEQEALVLAGRAGREAQRAARQLERVAVPVRDRQAFRQERESRPGPGGEFQREAADFDFRILDHAPAEGVGEKLRAKAHSDRRLACRDVPLDERAFAAQPWMIAIHVDVHRAAHDEEKIDRVRVGQRLSAIKMGRGDLPFPRRCPVGNCPGAFAMRVLEDVESCHRISGH